jgi:Tfp pilus assembly protein PilZ
MQLVTDESSKYPVTRASKRVRVLSPANFKKDGDERLSFGTIVVINSAGLYLATPEAFEPGEEIELSLSLPGRPGTYRSRARIVTIRETELPHGERVAGAGCAFLEPPPPLLDAILGLPASSGG